MSGMYGADVAQLRQLAAQFDSAASQLDSHRVMLGNAVRVSPWRGPDAAMFTHAWDSAYAPKVNGVAMALRAVADSLRSNASEQERASAVQGSGFGGGGGGGGWGNDAAQSPAELLTRFGLDSQTGQRYTWEAISHALREMEVAGVRPWDIASLGVKAGELMGSDYGWFGNINTAFDVVEIANGVIDGDPNYYDMAHAAADLIGKVPGPVAGAGSVAIHAWTYVGEELAKADFSADTRAMVGDYIAENPGVIVEEVGKAVLTVGTKLVSWLPL